MKNTVLKSVCASLLAASVALPSLAQPGSASLFKWRSSPPLIAPPADAPVKYYGVKDPSIVYFDGKYHVFMTTAGENGWAVSYTSFRDWSDAPSAPIISLDKSPMGPGYRAAPQLFYFAPQKLWYLVYQGGDPMYSTSKDISDPLSWSAPKPFFSTVPDVVKMPSGDPAWLDFWTICDDSKCYLFFTNDNGGFFRAETGIEQFPEGFHNTTTVLNQARDDVFEASNTYKVAGTDKYLTLIEAIGPKGRYFRAWTADRLDGEWAPLGSGPMNLFAGPDNVRFKGKAWSEGVSHGEMLRAGFDQTLTIDPCKPLQFLYQGLDPEGKVDDYIKLPYRLGLITAKGANPVSAMCPKRGK
jgi:endo-1,4-beta-xylanase